MPTLPSCQDSQDDAVLTVAQAMAQAIAAFQRGQWGEAEKRCRTVLEKKEDHFDALHLLGIIAANTRRPREASELLSRAIAANPNDATAYGNLGSVLMELGRPAEALVSYERAIALHPGLAEAHNNRGNALRDLGRSEEALASYERAITLKPGLAEAFYNRGVVLGDLERHTDALQSYERAIALEPGYAGAHLKRGILLANMGRPAQALQSFERTIALKPDYAEAYYLRGNALVDLIRPAEALQCFERAVALKPDLAEAHNNRGVMLANLKRHPEALQSYERAIALKPDYVPAHYNLATCRLILGDFAGGWPEYEWRRKGREFGYQERNFARPPWLGAESLQGRTILLYSEQGLGDTLQFCRYAKYVAALGANVLLQVAPPLAPLLRNLEGVAELVLEGDRLPAFDYHCPLLSLPLAFKTDLHSIPGGIPYIRSDPVRVTAWQKKLGARTKPRIGLVWSGNTAQRNDRSRSMALADVLPIIGGGADWISMQKEMREADDRLMAARPDIRQLGDALMDFADTAALVELVDVVLTVDTSAAHLAGAMGKTVWVLLSYPHDWRWLLDRSDSPWYPTARLFRQTASGDWTGVIASVRKELRRQFGLSVD